MKSTISININKCPRCGSNHNVSAEVNEKDIDYKQINFYCPNRKRLFKLINFQFDFTRNENKISDISDEYIANKYGNSNIDKKRKRWNEASNSNVWIFYDYRNKMNQVVDSYVNGNFYCAITAACCLIERALNILVISLREDYKIPEKYSKVISRDSHIQNWEICWATLIEWEIISKNHKSILKKIHRIRNDVCHYNPEFNYEIESKKVIKLVNDFLDSVFGVFNRDDIFHIFKMPGEIWVKEKAQNTPFVKKFVIPHCGLMTARSLFINHVYHEYDEGCEKISEEEFIKIRSDFNKSPRPENVNDIIQNVKINNDEWQIRII